MHRLLTEHLEFEGTLLQGGSFEVGDLQELFVIGLIQALQNWIDILLRHFKTLTLEFSFPLGLESHNLKQVVALLVVLLANSVDYAPLGEALELSLPEVQKERVSLHVNERLKFHLLSIEGPDSLLDSLVDFLLF